MNKQSYWDIFCKVIDNYGDIGVCWRLCTDLAQRGYRIRLWVDDPSALKWMAAHDHPLIEVIHSLDAHACSRALQPLERNDLPEVIIEAFGCDPEPSFLQLLEKKIQTTHSSSSVIWINLEYLSAEKYVENCHGLSSSSSQYPLLGEKKFFYYPGYTSGTGGLIRDPLEQQALLSLDKYAWLSSHQIEIPTHPQHEFISLFAYADAAEPLAPFLQHLIHKNTPTTLLITDCIAVPALQQWFKNHYPYPTGALKYHYLPRLSQKDYSRLLHCCDFNIVRGEDSATQALWSKAPFIWQLYPQEDQYHLEKLSAFLTLFQMPKFISDWFYQLNGPSVANLSTPNWQEWSPYFNKMRNQLLEQNDLSSQLIDFIKKISQG